MEISGRWPGGDLISLWNGGENKAFRSYKDNSCKPGKTDTMASSGSITSIKSVSILSQVKDCHFWDQELIVKNLHV